MSKRLRSFSLMMLIGCLSPIGQATETSTNDDLMREHCWPAIQSIDVEIKDIYDDEQDAWYQNLANATKANTKKDVVLWLLPFKVGDSICQTQLDEAERILRAVRYLRDPTIQLDPDGNMRVRVRDAWTIFPSFGFIRSGGRNSESVGIRDSNLFGFGINSTFRFKRDEQQSGFRLRIASPFYWVDKSNISLVLEDYDEGSATSFAFEKPFYTMHDTHMYGVSLSDENLEYTQFHNNQDEYRYESQVSAAAADYGWLHHAKAQTTERIILGLRSFDKEITDFSGNLYSEFTLGLRQSSVYTRFEYQKFDFKQLKNVRLITDIEDIDFGTRFAMTLGVGNYSLGEDKGDYWYLNGELKKGWHVGNWMLFNDIKVTGEIFSNSPNFIALEESLEVFYELPDTGTFYWATDLSYVSHYYYGVQNVGDETGVRGFPLQYQHGKSRWTSRLEFRQYTDLNLFESIAVGVAYFVDAGRAWDNPLLPNVEEGTLYSAGLGLRFFPHVVSGRNVVHMDIVRAFSDNLESSGFEFRLIVNNSF